MSRADLLIEIGVEEVPARMLTGAAQDLAARIAAVLDAAGLAHGETEVFCAPRRLAARVAGVDLAQASRDEEVAGPPVAAAKGPDGKPTKAAIGFAQKMGVDVTALAVLSTPKGDYLGVRRHVAGRRTPEVLAELLPRAVSSMTFPKTMRWGDGTRRFVRPIHWIVALLGEEEVPLEILGIRSGRQSSGHRVLGDKRFPLATAGGFEEALRAQGVTAEPGERRMALSRRLIEIAGEMGVRPVEDPELLEEITNLVEYPGATIGSFPKEFLSLPREILVTTLRHHQKAFSTETAEGLSHSFIVASDTDRDAEGHIRKGNEWVVVGRLEDARFFYQEDRKVPLASRREKLEHVTFHAKAGSYAAKSARLETIAVRLAGLTDARGKGGAGVDLPALRHAASLAKCDLTTGLVGEFPELQGIAGGLYLRAESEAGGATHPPRAADAIYDQYLPAGAGDALPRTPEGSLLALADRLDTLAALARAIGLPTGSKDPYGLRRAALGAIRIVAETPLPLSLAEMAAAAADAVRDTVTAGKESAAEREVLDFLVERFTWWLKEKGADYDTVNAVLRAAKGDRALDETAPRLAEKVFALQRLREQPEFAALVEIHRRCRNILEQADGAKPGAGGGGSSDPNETAIANELQAKVVDAERSVGSLMKDDAFEEALAKLVGMRPALTRFFDHVLVMHPETPTREARLGLVRRTAVMIEEVADLRQISIAREELARLLAQLSA